MPIPRSRGLGPDLVIVDKSNYVQPVQQAPTSNLPPIPTQRALPPVSSPVAVVAVKILRFGTGWIILKLSDGSSEKRSGGSLSWRYHNPGNIKYGAFARAHETIGKGWGGHSVFPSYTKGNIAKKNLLFTDKRKYYKLSITKAMSYYAPASDKGKGVPRGGNQPSRYANYIAKWIGVSPDTKLYQLTEIQREKMMDAMEKFEGFKKGTVVKL